MTSHAGHRIEKCRHGQLVMQCRCMTLPKPVVIVACPNDDWHKTRPMPHQHSDRR